VKKVLFVVGPALGHVGRSLMIARALSTCSTIHISFACVQPGYGSRLLYGEYPFIELPYEERGDTDFANRFEAELAKLAPDLICLDLTPTWLRFVRFPSIPIVYLTNFFLTKLGSGVTVQDQMFLKRAEKWNAERVGRGMEPLIESRSLYERDAVLLCDPSSMMPYQTNLPGHYHIVGPCVWESEIPCPSELDDLQSLLVISLGSTGTISLPIRFVEALADLLQTSNIVWVGGQDRAAWNLGRRRHLSYRWLPTQQILPISAFVITHGGAGSTYQALMYGVAVAVWPSHNNQKILGQVLEESGSGVLLGERPSEKLTLIGARLESMRCASRDIAKSLEGVSGPENAAAYILSML